MKKYNEYDDDDGRTIADMSDVTRPAAFTPRRKEPRRPKNHNPSQQGSFLFEKQEEPFTREERRMYVLGALKASLLIAAAFIVGLGVAILIMILAWG